MNVFHIAGTNNLDAAKKSTTGPHESRTTDFTVGQQRKKREKEKIDIKFKVITAIRQLEGSWNWGRSWSDAKGWGGNKQ